MSKRIFISTDATLHGIFGGINYLNLQSKLNNSNLSLLNDENTDLVYFNGQTFDKTSIQADIIIVKDSSTKTLAGINAANDFLLHHTQTDAHIRNVVEKFEGRKIQGRHPDLFYLDVFKIIFDDSIFSANKCEKIINAVFYDPEEEKLTEAIFTAIYDKKSEQEIEAVVKERDNHVNIKLNKK